MNEIGLVLKSNGGLYDVQIGEQVISCPARGVFRHEKTKVLVGDRVRLARDEDATRGVQIETVEERKTLIDRPPMANLDLLFIVIAAKKPAPILSTVDRLLALASDCGVKAALILTKSDLSEEEAGRIADIYRLSGYDVLVTSAQKDGEEEKERTRQWICNLVGDGIAAFAGASGVGKSSLIRSLFPSLPLEVGNLSKKVDRGRQTTRMVCLYPLRDLMDGGTGYLADTPGFSVLDYVHKSKLTKENLPLAFPEFLPYIGQCRYTDCTHRKEEECAILDALREGKIAPERHGSYVEMYEELRGKHPWD